MGDCRGRWASVALAVIRPSYMAALVGRHRLLVGGSSTAAGMGVLWVLRFGLDSDQFGATLGRPFLGYIVEPSVQSIGLFVFAAVTLAVGLRHRDWSWVASAAMVMCFTGPVLHASANAWRAAGLLFVLWAFGPGYSPSHRQQTDSSHRVIDLTGEAPPVLTDR